MRRTVLLLLALIVSVALLGTSLQKVHTQTDLLTLHFDLPAYKIETSRINGVESRKIVTQDVDAEQWSENLDGLPQIEKWIYLPKGYRAEATLQNTFVSSKEGIDLTREEMVQDTDGWLQVSEPMILRGNKIQSFRLKPFTYSTDNKKLTILEHADLKISFIPTQDNTPTTDRTSPVSLALLQSMCINREGIRTAAPAPGSYIIFYNGTSLQSTIQPLADWKHEKGYDVRMVNTSTIGNTTTSIKSYLQTAYDTWTDPPEYILILGRATGTSNNVPTYNENYNYNTAGDYHYTLLDGADLVPDAFIGRITFSSTDELQTAVNRIISYEKMQGLSTTNWLNKSFLLGDATESGVGCITAIQYVKSLIQDYDPDLLLTETYTGPFPSQINSALNSGVGTYWNRSHGDFSGWTSSDINNLNNAGKFFFFSYLTCFTGNFGSSTSISQAERLLRLGTPTVPRGAIGVIGCSCETHTCLNNIVTAGIAYGMYKEGLTECGPAMVRGKLALMASYPQNPANYINQYMQQVNLIGDPGVSIWLQPPTSITVTAPAQVYTEGGSIEIRVTTTDGLPVNDAWVCLTKGASELFVTGRTNSAGYVILPYDNLTTGSVILTVTKPNFKTWQSVLNVVSGAATLALQNIPELVLCNAGSSKTFDLAVYNNGTIAFNGLNGLLQPLSEYITVYQDSSAFGIAEPNAVTTSQTAYQISIATETPKGSSLGMNLHLNWDGGSTDLPITFAENGPAFAISEVNFTNNVLIHGANSLTFTLHNTSSTPIAGLEAILESTHPLVNISNTNQNLGGVEGNQSVVLPAAYVINISDSLAIGLNLSFNLRLFNNNGFEQVMAIDKVFGSPSANVMTGPDSYGYVCYGPGDANYVAYNWLEIDPALGGTGTNLNLSDLDTEGGGASTLVNLNFQLRFYGQTYSQILVCSNGFIKPGNQSSIEWMNWPIPGPLVPKPIIAPFWDDLLTDSLSRILYKYDSSLHAEIIQWQNLKNKFSPNLRETFEVILYDPVYYASPTGDSPILFQYKVFNNVDAGNYGLDYIDQGQYATVGIADHTGMTGIGYTYNNQYPLTAGVLSNLSTLYFTTLPTYQVAAEPIILNCQMTEIAGNGNGTPDAGETLNLSFMFKNIGLAALQETQVELTSFDPYLTIIQGQASLPILSCNQSETANPVFQIQVGQNCPNQHILLFNLQINNSFQHYVLPFEFMVNALQVHVENFLYSDGNNGFAEPGENGQLHFTLENLSLLPAQNLNVSIEHNDEVSIDPITQVVSIPAMGSVNLSFNISIGNGVQQGSLFNIGIHAFETGIYDSLMTRTILVGVPDVFISTDFETTNINTAFQTLYNVQAAPAQYIHNTGNEAEFFRSPQNPYCYAFCYPLPTLDLLASRIQFTWYSTFTGAEFSLLSLYPNETTLNTVWSSMDSTSAPRTENIVLSEFPGGAEYVLYIFMANFTNATSGVMVMDDLSILTMHHAPGIITGHINLDLYPELASQARLNLKYGNQVYNPDAEGNFSIPAYQGLNVIYASLEGYINTVDSLAANVISNQVTANHDIYFQRMLAPVNMTYSINVNHLTLSWDLEGQAAKKGSKQSRDPLTRFLMPDYYRIWIICNSFTFQDTCSTPSYDFDMYMNGDYRIHTCSVYLVNGGEEALSSPSNQLEFNYTPATDEHVAAPVFALQQNQPNPFNPETRISFSLPAKQAAQLCIYNLKGQKVRTLVDNALDKGSHDLTWNGKDEKGNTVSSGVYYYKLRSGSKELIRKMVLLK